MRQCVTPIFFHFIENPSAPGPACSSGTIVAAIRNCFSKFLFLLKQSCLCIWISRPVGLCYIMDLSIRLMMSMKFFSMYVPLMHTIGMPLFVDILMFSSS